MLWMTLNKSHVSFCLQSPGMSLLCRFASLSAFMFIGDPVWAVLRGLEAYVPFGILISSVSLKMPVLEITTRKEQHKPEKAGRVCHSTWYCCLQKQERGQQKNIMGKINCLMFILEDLKFLSRVTFCLCTSVHRQGCGLLVLSGNVSVGRTCCLFTTAVLPFLSVRFSKGNVIHKQKIVL